MYVQLILHVGMYQLALHMRCTEVHSDSVGDECKITAVCWHFCVFDMLQAWATRLSQAHAQHPF